MLDLNRLEKVKERGNKITATCPACKAEGKDKKGVHLYYNPSSEKFGCIAHQGDSDHNRAIWSYAGITKELTDEEKQEWKRRKDEENARQCKRLLAKARDKQIAKKIPQFLSPFIVDEWCLEMLDESPIRFRDEESLRHEFLLRMFYMDDILWLGDKRTDSGEQKHAKNFRTVAEWIKQEKLPQMISAGTFHAGSISRGKDFVKLAPYIVIESDDIIGYEPVTQADKDENKKLSAALIRYAQHRLGLILRAVIITGNKSLHAWFDRPSEDDFRALLSRAKALCIDTGVLESCQSSPLRLPGCLHPKTNKKASLIYLNPIT
jgi:hypothetical protein